MGVAKAAKAAVVATAVAAVARAVATTTGASASLCLVQLQVAVVELSLPMAAVAANHSLLLQISSLLAAPLGVAREVKSTVQSRIADSDCCTKCLLTLLCRTYGSGYPGVNSRGVSGLGFPFIFWPVVWGGGLGYGAAYLHDTNEVCHVGLWRCQDVLLTRIHMGY